MRRPGDITEAAVLVALALIGVADMALHPRRALRVLAGGSWWEDRSA